MLRCTDGHMRERALQLVLVVLGLGTVAQSAARSEGAVPARS
jgi:hypothetical protein